MNEHDIQNVSVEGKMLRIDVDGVSWTFDLALHSKRLANATPEQCANLQVSSSGYGIHWPDVDEDLSINGLIRDSQG
jgi:hypothetical protein